MHDLVPTNGQLPAPIAERVAAEMKKLEADLTGDGLYSPPQPIEQPAKHIPPLTPIYERRGRQWPWYALQVSIYLTILVSDIELKWTGDNPYVGLLITVLAAAFATLLVSLSIDAYRWLRTLPFRLKTKHSKPRSRDLSRVRPDRP